MKNNKITNWLLAEASSSSGNAQGIEYGGMPPVSSVGFDIKLTF